MSRWNAMGHWQKLTLTGYEWGLSGEQRINTYAEPLEQVFLGTQEGGLGPETYSPLRLGAEIQPTVGR